MKLYYSRGACSLASHIALVESGQPYDKLKVDLKSHTTEDGRNFYDISPRGYVPAIEDDGLGLLSENSAVLPYIADKTGAALSGAAHYRMLDWIGFVGTVIHAGYKPLFGGAPEAEQAEAKRLLAEKYRLAADMMEGRHWLAGDRPTVADNYLFVTLLWAQKFGIETPPALADYRCRNLDRPSVRQAMKEEGLG